MNSAIHDPSTGFHDIKAIPGFNPLPIVDSLWIIILLIIIAAILYWILKIKKPFRASTTPRLPADEEALAALSSLDSERKSNLIPLRTFAAGLSETIRRYLEREMKFPAMERTSQEVADLFAANAKKQLPTVPASSLGDIQLRLKGFLRTCDRMSFADNSEKAYDLHSESVESQLVKARELVRELAHWNKKERERTRSIVEQSKLAEAQGVGT